MVVARWKTATNKSNSMNRKTAEVLTEMEAATASGAEEDFKAQKVKAKRSFTSGKTWEVEVGKNRISCQHQSVGRNVTGDPLEKGLTRKTARDWWIALGTTKELEGCLKKLDCEVSRKRRNWHTQQRAEVNKLELRSQLGRTWEKLLQD